MTAVDPRAELERAARKQRDKVAAADDKAAREEHAIDAKRLRYRRVMRQEALAGRAGNWLLNIAILGSLVGAMAVGVLRFNDGVTGILETIGLLVAMLVVTIALSRVAEKALASAHLGRLAARARGLDVVRYQDQLSENYSSAHVDILVTFERPFPEADRETVGDAMKTWLRTTRETEWQGGVLRIRSQPLKTTEYIPGGSTGGAYSGYNNRELHEWTAKAVRKLVPKLAALAPVMRVEVDIGGSVQPWDDER